MKRLLLLCLCLVCSSCVVNDVENALRRYKSVAYDSILECTNEYAEHSGADIPREIDRVFVLATDAKFELIFARGEVGIFGRRSESYRAFLSCGVLNEQVLQIYFLGEPLKDSLIASGEIGQVAEDDAVNVADMWDLMFLRNMSGEFSFSEIKRYNDALIGVLPSNGIVE